MLSRITVEQEIHFGKEVVIECPSHSTHFAVVFEDDSETGYFYGVDMNLEGDPILDALHIYDVHDIIKRSTGANVQIAWSEDGLKSALLLNSYPHAVLDFEAKRGYCRNCFPLYSGKWSDYNHDWDDSALDHFVW